MRAVRSSFGPLMLLAGFPPNRNLWTCRPQQFLLQDSDQRQKNIPRKYNIITTNLVEVRFFLL
ncbi:hypothetical protein MESS4_370073 [Mesorhizobium sp. STM 4661]|nr:hypothetical protein MESS4_370073 [Mesorhizobium sp. STM 4661]